MTNPDALVAEAGARLHDAAKRLPAALRAIAAAMPGYPSSSGGGGGGTSELTVVEALAMSLGRDPAVSARNVLASEMRACCVQAVEVARHAQIPVLRVPPRPSDDVDMARALEFAVALTDRLQAVRLPGSAFRASERLWGASAGVYGVVVTDWGRRRIAKPGETGDGADEIWCSHCRAHGVMAPRDRRGDRSRGTLCIWCAKYRVSAGHLPPAALVKQHGEGRRVTIADIRRHDPAHARALGAA